MENSIQGQPSSEDTNDIAYEGQDTNDCVKGKRNEYTIEVRKDRQQKDLMLSRHNGKDWSGDVMSLSMQEELKVGLAQDQLESLVESKITIKT